MDRIAQSSDKDRMELFRSTAEVLQPQRSPAIVEKDFWVCWALHRIYDALQFRPKLIFKGALPCQKPMVQLNDFLKMWTFH